MTDLDLLTAAAKAAGITCDWSPIKPDYDANQGQQPVYWNPLEDDGDALRLAVSLRMNINIYATGAEADCDTLESTCKEGGDPYAATRRAIVRAAAAMADGSNT